MPHLRLSIDPYSDMILADGISVLCNDLQVEPQDIVTKSSMRYTTLLLGGRKRRAWRLSLGLLVAARMNYVDNTGAKNLYVISVKGIKDRLNRLPSACVVDMVMATVKKGKPDLRKKVLPAVMIRQCKPWHEKTVFSCMLKIMRDSAITGLIEKECADLWPRIANAAKLT
ncbi:unnamed protein product [Thlaspi arvense]|uniref:Uncharacterized protein n=1 Tax=Thlaspi arvense TaxID=13288 RepID=A0AAU9RNW1_THLAR|nr:unnamed protein product [Thlaspi arvense]